MFGTRWRLFRLLGIPVSLDLSWLVIFALLTWTLVLGFPGLLRQIYGDTVAEPSLGVRVAMGLAASLTFFLCIILHEFGHAVVARAVGIPIRGITLFLFGGVAEMEREPERAQDEFLMAIGGPVVSLILSGLFAVLTAVGAAVGWPPPVVVVLGYLAAINTVVLVFNLVPAFPLDGGRVFRSVLWGILGNLRRATWWAAGVGQAFAWVLIALGLTRVFAGDFVGGFWMGLLGLFLNNAAQGSYRQVVIRQVLEGEPVSRFMNPHPIVVPPDLDLQSWVEDQVYRHHHKTYPVVASGRLEGLIDTAALAEIPRSEWDRHQVGEVMQRDLSNFTLPPDADALQALSRMQRSGSTRLLIVQDGALRGILSLKDLLRFLDLKLELEGEEGIGHQQPRKAVRESERPEIPVPS